MDTFRHAIDARFKAFELAKSAIVKPSTLVVLDTSFLIWTQPSNMLTASHIQAQNSTAKVHYAVDSDSPDLEPSDSVIPLLSFYFQWENPGPNPVSLENVASHLDIQRPRRSVAIGCRTCRRRWSRQCPWCASSVPDWTGTDWTDRRRRQTRWWGRPLLERAAVHQPHRWQAVAVLPQDVAREIGVEIAGLHDGVYGEF